MKATIVQVNRTASGYDVVVELEDNKGKVFNFLEEVTVQDIRKTIKTWLEGKKEQKGRLPQLKTALIGDVIEV